MSAARIGAKKPALAHEIFDRLSTEQQTQIYRLMDAGKFQDVDEVIETLAAAALFMFGLDPVARDAFDRVSSVVYGDGAEDEYFVNVLINEDAGEKWTRAQRNAERAGMMKGKAA